MKNKKKNKNYIQIKRNDTIIYQNNKHGQNRILVFLASIISLFCFWNNPKILMENKNLKTNKKTPQTLKKPTKNWKKLTKKQTQKTNTKKHSENLFKSFLPCMDLHENSKNN